MKFLLCLELPAKVDRLATGGRFGVRLPRFAPLRRFPRVSVWLDHIGSITFENGWQDVTASALAPDH
jgi:hypothetical protein